MVQPRPAAAAVPVLYVLRRHAKTVKTALEDANLIDADRRMIPAAANVGGGELCGCVAIPVLEECIDLLATKEQRSGDDGGGVGRLTPSSSSGGGDGYDWMGLVVGSGRHPCPASAAALAGSRQGGTSGGGSRRRRRRRCGGGACDGSTAGGSRAGRHPTVEPLSTVQLAVKETLLGQMRRDGGGIASGRDRHENVECADEIESAVRSLPPKVCPRKLERIGDDRTLVVPRTALTLDDAAFRSLLDRFALCSRSARRARATTITDERKVPLSNDVDRREEDEAIVNEMMASLWSNLARLHSSPRVARRGDIDPGSGVRASGHRLLWPETDANAGDGSENSCCKYPALEPGLPAATGPGSPGWITVTEHGIRQSFDLTRVMFSRGNVTEKLRFGRDLVQEGEVVLDFYAGIGYFALPALVLGKAKHVIACEWNPEAAAALRYNLRDNGVDGRATMLEGDSRVSAASVSGETGVMGAGVDRVSLGLLPSSEGGWAAALASLRTDSGGWMHIHGNVPTPEREQWALWVCSRLAELAGERGRRGWVALCCHVEKVKSFAPRVDHCVADVFVGPSVPDCVASVAKGYGTGILSADGSFVPCPAQVDPPSCALSRGGILHQEWMM